MPEMVSVSSFLLFYKKGKGKGKDQPRTGHEGVEGGVEV